MSAVKHTTIVSFSQDAVTLIDGEHRIHDLALAETLGFEKPYNIRDLIKLHENALKSFGELIFRTVRKNTRGRPGKAYHLNEHQAVFLCTRSETANATALTIRIVKTFVAVKRGHPMHLRHHLDHHSEMLREGRRHADLALDVIIAQPPIGRRGNHAIEMIGRQAAQHIKHIAV